MQILITGGTGLVGQALVAQLLKMQYSLTLLTRSPKNAKKKFNSSSHLDFINTVDDYQNLDQFDAIINLQGAPIFDKAWTPQQKERLSQSRIAITKKLSNLINISYNKPHTFISGSASGYYGDQGSSLITEESQVGNDFAANLCKQWEGAALQADTRVCLLRTSPVLSIKGGALAKMLPIYRYCLGGRLGMGRQYWPWIQIKDMVNSIIFLLTTPFCKGAYNISSPEVPTNAEFNRTLAQVLHRPALACVPHYLFQKIMGERSQLLLNSQRMYPERLIKAGFKFIYSDLGKALHYSIFNKN